WQAKLAVDADGSVTVATATGYRRRFQPDGRTTSGDTTSYFSQQGDHGTLTKTNGSFMLKEPDGNLTHFFAIGRLDYYQDTNGNRITAGYSNGVFTSLTSSGGQSLTIAYKNLST